jgi:hypothetical protein
MHPIIIFASFEAYLQFNGPLWKHAFSLFQLLPIPNQIIFRTSHMLQRRNAKKLNTKKWWQCATYHDTSALPKLSMLRLVIATREKWSFTDNILASLAPRRSLLHIHLSSPTSERHYRHGV